MVIGNETAVAMIFELKDFKHKGGLFGPVSRTFNEGSCCHIVGKNGAGKTTFLRKIAWAIVHEAPTVSLPKSWHPPFFHYIAHGAPLHPTLTLWENLSLCSPHTQPALGSEGLTLWGLQDKKNTPIHKLSEGEKKRAHLTRLTLSPCHLWLLDEPFNHLDGHFKYVLQKVIEEHIKKKGIALISHHGPLPFHTENTIHLGSQGGDLHV